MRRAALLLALALACGGGGLARVEQAPTAAQEREAFAALARGGVGFSAHDVAGATVETIVSLPSKKQQHGFIGHHDAPLWTGAIITGGLALVLSYASWAMIKSGYRLRS